MATRGWSAFLGHKFGRVSAARQSGSEVRIRGGEIEVSSRPVETFELIVERLGIVGELGMAARHDSPRGPRGRTLRDLLWYFGYTVYRARGLSVHYPSPGKWELKFDPTSTGFAWRRIHLGCGLVCRQQRQRGGACAVCRTSTSDIERMCKSAVPHL